MIASSLSTPGDVAPQVAEALRKAGVKDFPDLGKRREQELKPSPDDEETTVSTASPDDGMASRLDASIDSTATATPVEPEPDPNEDLQEPKPRKKSVSFTADTKKSDATRSSTRTPNKRANPYPAAFGPSTSEVSRALFAKSIIEEDHEDSKEPLTNAVIPDESPEDAALRRQMLRYGMQEVGAIVAEINLDEGESTPPYSDDEDDDYDETTDEDEDQFGRTKRQVVDDDYRRQMLELERKLNAKAMENVGPNPDTPVVTSKTLGTCQKDESEVVPSASSTTREESAQRKKGVRFAEALDVSEAAPTRPKKTSKTSPEDSPEAERPIADAVIERTARSADAADNASKTNKSSRFKTTRNQIASTESRNVISENGFPKALTTDTVGMPTPLSKASPSPKRQQPLQPSRQAIATRTRTVPEGPPGKVYAEKLIERPPTDTVTDVTEPDEFDPSLMHQELAVEYHRMRNRMIQRNGGFMRQEEEPAQTPIDEEEQLEGGRKMSKFKAARLARLGK